MSDAMFHLTFATALVMRLFAKKEEGLPGELAEVQQQAGKIGPVAAEKDPRKKEVLAAAATALLALGGEQLASKPKATFKLLRQVGGLKATPELVAVCATEDECTDLRPTYYEDAGFLSGAPFKLIEDQYRSSVRDQDDGRLLGAGASPGASAGAVRGPGLQFRTPAAVATR